MSLFLGPLSEEAGQWYGLGKFTFQKICSLSPSAHAGPSEVSSALPITEPKFSQLPLIEALTGILGFPCKSSSNLLFFLFTFLAFQKSKTWALSADPEERNCLVKEFHLALKENVWGEEVQKIWTWKWLDPPWEDTCRVFLYFYVLTC